MLTTVLFRSLGLAALTALLAQPMKAQSAPRPGDRIRVHAAGAAPVEGRLVRLLADQIVFRTEGVHHRAALDGTIRVEHRYVRTRAREGAILGGLTGLAMGLTVPTGGGGCSGNSFCPQIFSEGEERMIAVSVMTLAGTLIGALIGVAIRTEVWEPIGPGAVPPVGPAAAVATGFASPAISFGVKLRM